jgi:hypothetical protein
MITIAGPISIYPVFVNGMTVGWAALNPNRNLIGWSQVSAQDLADFLWENHNNGNLAMLFYNVECKDFCSHRLTG